MNDREKFIELICESINDECSVHCNLSSPTKCFQCTCIADHLIANGVTVQEWISVNDRLPENEQDVIICAERRHYSNPNRFIRIVAKAFYTDGKHNTEHTAYAWNNDCIDMEYDEENDAYLIPEGWWESVEYGEEFSAVSDFVTHWMPLPQPTEGE